jgi:hypothetical protein
MSDYPTDPADILEAAADLLETKGWIQGGEYKADGPCGRGKRVAYCAIGAIREVVGFYDFAENHGGYEVGWGASTVALVRANGVAGLLCMGGHGFTSVIRFNDAPGRTADEVIDLMKHTAKDLRNKETPA